MLISGSMLFAFAIFVILMLIFGSIINIVDYQYHSNLRILGLDILTPSSIDFVVKDNLIHLHAHVSLYNEPSSAGYDLAKLIGAEIKLVNSNGSKKLEWYKDGILFFTSYGHSHILLTPTGNVVKYDKQKRFSIKYGKKPLNAILRSAEDGNFEMKQLRSCDKFKYEKIDTYDWSKH